MPAYRFYYVDSDGHIGPPTVAEFKDDRGLSRLPEHFSTRKPLKSGKARGSSFAWNQSTPRPPQLAASSFLNSMRNAAAHSAPE
jgi:hypothetical protein